jgi:hypothetical protein
MGHQELHHPSGRIDDTEVEERKVRAFSHHHASVLTCLFLFSSTLFYGPSGRIGLTYSWSKTKVLNSTKAATFTMAQLIENAVEDHHATELPTLYQPDRDGLKTLHSIRYNKTNYTWAHNFDILTQTGHKWCSILRDNHACFGDKYAAILNITTPFQGRRYNLLSFQAKHERILAVGNSHLLELLYLPICATPSIFGYYFGYNTFLFHTVQAEHKRREVTMLILDNDKDFASPEARPERTIEFLDEINFSPTIIIIGKINGAGGVKDLQCKQRQKSYAERFPHARIICRCGTLLPGPVGTGIADSCSADGNDCESKASEGHQCVPSRGVIHGSEDLWSEMIEERAFRSQCPT